MTGSMSGTAMTERARERAAKQTEQPRRILGPYDAARCVWVAALKRRPGVDSRLLRISSPAGGAPA